MRQRFEPSTGTGSTKDPPRRKLSSAEMLVAATLIAVACVAGFLPLAAVVGGYLAFVNLNVYLLAVHAGAVPLCLATNPRGKDVVLYLFAATILFFATLRAAWPVPGAYRLCSAAVLAVGSVAILRLAISSASRTVRNRAFARHALLAILAMQAAVAVSRILLIVVSRSVTVTFDRYLYACDASFGGQASFAVGRLFNTIPGLGEFCLLVYYSLPFGVLFLFANLRGGHRLRWLLLANFVLIGIVGRYCYLFVPAMGPIYEFPGRFPGNPPLVPVVLEPAHSPQALYNAMPSLHASWALMLSWWTQGQQRWLRITAAFFLLFTLLATLGLGEHYLIDLVVAVPFSVSTFAIITVLLPGHRFAWAAFGVGAGLSALWFILLRSSPRLLATSPHSIWLLSAITLALSLRVMHRQCVSGLSPRPVPSDDDETDSIAPA